MMRRSAKRYDVQTELLYRLPYSRYVQVGIRSIAIDMFRKDGSDGMRIVKRLIANLKEKGYDVIIFMGDKGHDCVYVRSSDTYSMLAIRKQCQLYHNRIYQKEPMTSPNAIMPELIERRRKEFVTHKELKVFKAYSYTMSYRSLSSNTKKETDISVTPEQIKEGRERREAGYRKKYTYERTQSI